MMELREISLVEYPEWDELVRAFGGTIFHSRAWLSAATRHHPIRPNHLLARRGGAPVGILPLFLRSFGIVKVAASPFVVEDNPYLGPITDPSVPLCDLTPPLLEYVQQSGFHFLRVMPWSDEEAGDVVDKSTHILSLEGSEEGLWQGMTSKCRNRVRKAQKSGVSIEEIRERAEIERYYQILESIYAAQGLPTPNPLGFFNDLWDAYGMRQVRFLKALYRGEMVAGAIIVVDGETAYYLNGAAQKEFNSLAPSNLLQWEAIRLCRSLGARQYDFVNSDLPRLAQFKASFGGALTTYGCLEVASSKWVGYLRGKYPDYKKTLEKLTSWRPKP